MEYERELVHACMSTFDSVRSSYYHPHIPSRRQKCPHHTPRSARGLRRRDVAGERLSMPAPTPPSPPHAAARPPAPLLYMIGNAHIDPVWLWRWPEGCAEAIGTCWAAVELLDEQPGLIFTRGEAAIYRWIEDYDPPLFARIREHVSAGRWTIVNGWWIQPDCNLPHGEALLRQALYGKRYFRERFGVDVTVGYNVDSFGHAGTLPMLLRHTGSRSYVFMRPQAHEKDLPGALFDWEAPDGSRVEAFRVQVAYATAPEMLRERIAHDEVLARDAGYPFMCFFGIGDHGGGPTRADLALIHALQADGHDLTFGDPARYFAAVAAVPRPRVRDELQYHAIGCYAAVSALKALNRRAESALAQAESACALALLHTGAPYPRAALRGLWQTLLFNHFHDILAGTSIPSATSDALEALGGVVQGAEALLHASLRRLAATVIPVAPGPDAVFLVFNLTGMPQDVPIEYEPWLAWRSREPRRLLDDAGEEVAYQDLPPESYAEGMRRILFASCVPTFGYRLFRFAPGVPSAVSSSLHAGDALLENARWRLEVDPATGGIARLYDRCADRELLAGVGHLAVVVNDPTDTWSHGIDRFGTTGLSMSCDRLQVVETGPLRAGIRVQARAGDSLISSTYLLHDDPAQPIEIRVRVDWRERRRLLRLCYPLALAAPTFRYEVPYGSMTRPADGREWPGQRWVLAIEDGGYGIALTNGAKYSYAADGAALYITALRSPAFAHHDPYVLQPGEEYTYTDQGEQSFTLRLLAGPGIDARVAHMLAEELHRPPVVTPHVARGGHGPWRADLLPIEARSVVPTWLKVAEDGDDLIMRLLEVAGERDTVVLPGALEPVPVAPYSVTTLRGTPASGWRVSDGLEI